LERLDEHISGIVTTVSRWVIAEGWGGATVWLRLCLQCWGPNCIVGRKRTVPSTRIAKLIYDRICAVKRGSLMKFAF
jgi:hypothetical protein